LRLSFSCLGWKGGVALLFLFVMKEQHSSDDVVQEDSSCHHFSLLSKVSGMDSDIGLFYFIDRFALCCPVQEGSDIQIS
jgi:hypothetical protein